MKTIRIGLVGCGGMMSSHAKAIQKVETIDVTAVCDVVVERAQEVANALGGATYVTADYRTMVEHVDAVLVALPHDLHFECGMFFARHKKHVLMEKPLCNSEEECIRLIRTCEEEGVVLMCAYPLRFKPHIVKLKELIDSGDYGRVMQVSMWTEQLTVSDELNWISTERLGGGQFFSHGCHYIDAMLWFLGNPVKGIHFGTRVGTPWLLHEGTSVAIMKFENGALGYHGATWGAHGTKLDYEFQIMTEKGLIAYHHTDKEIHFYDQARVHVPGSADEYTRKYKVIWSHEEPASSGKNTNHEIEHFADCILNGKRPITDGYTALQGLRAIWKMYDAEKHNVVADLRGCGLDQLPEKLFLADEIVTT